MKDYKEERNLKDICNVSIFVSRIAASERILYKEYGQASNYNEIIHSRYGIVHISWKYYRRSMLSNVSKGGMFLGGDALCQFLESPQKWSEFKFDFKRMAQMASFGFCVLGPAGTIDSN